ncbi:MAG TPA: hypothetical protein VF800_27460 [Telluria sp.]
MIESPITEKALQRRCEGFFVFAVVHCDERNALLTVWGMALELKIEAQARGVRIIASEEARNRRALLDQLITIAEATGFEEIILPQVEPSSVYVDKAGPEILSPMYVFPDKKNRSYRWLTYFTFQRQSSCCKWMPSFISGQVDPDSELSITT